MRSAWDRALRFHAVSRLPVLRKKQPVSEVPGPFPEDSRGLLSGREGWEDQSGFGLMRETLTQRVELRFQSLQNIDNLLQLGFRNFRSNSVCDQVPVS